MTNTLPPLTLDDLRVAEPDRDSAEVFDASETWGMCVDNETGAIARGYSPDTVADLLMTLPPGELDHLREWWAGECDVVASEGFGRDALCNDLLLCQSLDACRSDGWPLPLIDPATVLELLAERDALKAALRDVLALDDDGDTVAVATLYDLIARIKSLIGEAS